MEYKITITNNAQEASKPVISSQASTMSPTDLASPAPSGEINVKMAGAYVSAQLIKPFITQAISYHTSNVGLVTGSAEAQAKTDLAMSGISGATSLISSAIGGAAAIKLIGIGGAAAGPIGAIIGATMFAAQKGISLMYKEQQLQLNKQVEEQQLTLARSRYGTSVNRSRRN